MDDELARKKPESRAPVKRSNQKSKRDLPSFEPGEGSSTGGRSRRPKHEDTFTVFEQRKVQRQGTAGVGKSSSRKVND